MTINAHPRAAHVQRRHRTRIGDRPAPAPDATPELAAAWRSLQLHWLATAPGYRETIRQRVDEASRARAVRETRVEGKLPPKRSIERHVDESELRRGLRELIRDRDVDELGREIEGCG